MRDRTVAALQLRLLTSTETKASDASSRAFALHSSATAADSNAGGDAVSATGTRRRAVRAAAAGAEERRCAGM